LSRPPDRVDPWEDRVGTEAHYRDASHYDHTYRRRRADVRFYGDMVEERGARSVLELGAGTGRVTAEMATRGASVLAVEPVREMLARARERFSRLPADTRGRIAIERGDARTLRLDRRFPLVVAPFNVFMHLYSRRDWERALAAARRHLTTRGRLVFDVRMPDPAELARDPTRNYKGRPVRHPADGRRYLYAETFEYDPVTQVQLVTMIFRDPDDASRFFISPLSQRHVFPAELEALLRYNGFTMEHRYGDFDRSPPSETSETQIVVARPRRR